MNELEPGDASFAVAQLVAPWLQQHLDVVVRPLSYEVRRLTSSGWQREEHPEPSLSADTIRVAIGELSELEIPAGMTGIRIVQVAGERARMVLFPRSSIFGGGPTIYYRWLPSLEQQ